MAASLRYTFDYLHSNQQFFFSQREHQQSGVVKIWRLNGLLVRHKKALRFQRARKEIAREREKNALKKKIKHERKRAHKSISHRNLHTALIALAGKIWWCVNSCDILQQDGQRTWHNAHKRVFDLARANESYYPYCKWISQKLSYLYSNI